MRFSQWIIVIALFWYGSILHSIPSIQLVPFIQGLKRPVHLTWAPNDSLRAYGVEQAGRIQILHDGKVLAEPFLDIRSRVTSGGEMGLLCMAFHPKFAVNRRFFVNYTATRKQLVSVISEFKAGSSEEKEILSFDQPYSNHNGGQLDFGKDGYLYIATGDGGSAGDPHGNGQNKNTLLGKILRIDVDRDSPYAIPPDNPLLKGGGRKEIYAWGLRNPWRFSFDRATGLLFAADVGQNAYEEIDIIEKGKNYGWNIMEAGHCFKPKTHCNALGLMRPLFEYSQAHGYSITGGFVYRGKTILDLYGKYIYADYGSGSIWALTLNFETRKAMQNELLLDTRLPITSFGEDPDGELYVVSHSGVVYKMAQQIKQR